MEIVPMQETELEKKMKVWRAKAMRFIRPQIQMLIFAMVSGYVLLWVLNKYGEGRLIVSCTVLIAVLLFRANSRGRY
jgi:hypothetical protein